MFRLDRLYQTPTPGDLERTIRRFKNLFDPACRLNPGKVLPTGKEIRQRPELVV